MAIIVGCGSITPRLRDWLLGKSRRACNKTPLARSGSGPLGDSSPLGDHTGVILRVSDASAGAGSIPVRLTSSSGPSFSDLRLLT